MNSLVSISSDTATSAPSMRIGISGRVFGLDAEAWLRDFAALPET